MDRDGVDLQVMSATPVLFAYERPVEHALDCARLFNDAALELCGRGKGRLKSLCQVPLQDVDAACKELSRCMRDGHLGVQIGNHVGDKNLDDRGIVTFLQHCADEGAAVLVHPWEMFGQERMPKYMMPWTVGMPAETQLSVVAMILSGAFDRLPGTLRICFAHGGGSFAFLLGRLENAWHHHPVARGESEHPPSYYLNGFFVDSAVFDQRALQFLVGTMGRIESCSAPTIRFRWARNGSGRSSAKVIYRGTPRIKFWAEMRSNFLDSTLSCQRPRLARLPGQFRLLLSLDS